MRGAIFGGLAALGLVCGAPLAAQGPAPVENPVSSILTIDEEQLFFGSLFGRRVMQELGTAQRALEAEDKRILAELSAEEDALTEARGSMPAEDFRKAADAFDAKVVQLRAEIEEKGRALNQRLDTERQRFRNQVAPILGQIVQDRGAAVILERRQVFASIDQVDITDTAIARINQVLGDGALLGPPQEE